MTNELNSNEKLIEEIKKLKKAKKVTIIAHFYQPIEVQQVADFIGDSLALAEIARDKIIDPNIVFAGVRFMAETASILNQQRRIFSPDPTALCPLADYLTPKKIQTYKKKYPNAPVVVYVNTTADVKAMADVCCTSSNALNIIPKAAKKWDTNTILFGPDKNLAAYIAQTTHLNIIPIPAKGNCPYHNNYKLKDIERARAENPKAKILVHPESPLTILNHADYVGSTAAIEKYVANTDHPEGYVIGTEVGMLDYLRWKFPTKKFFPLSSEAMCIDMKKITLQKIYDLLQKIGTPDADPFEIRVPSEIAQNAKKSIEMMFELPNQK
jgi:quinolinate synthase